MVKLADSVAQFLYILNDSGVVVLSVTVSVVLESSMLIVQIIHVVQFYH